MNSSLSRSATVRLIIPRSNLIILCAMNEEGPMSENACKYNRKSALVMPILRRYFHVCQTYKNNITYIFRLTLSAWGPSLYVKI